MSTSSKREISTKTVTLSSSASGASNISHIKPPSIGNGAVVNGGVHTIRTTTITTGGNIPTNVNATIGLSSAKLFAEATERERQEIHNLNDRLANYIARVKLLEDQNKELVAALLDLRGRWSTKNDSFKQSIQQQVVILRGERDAAVKGKAAAEVQVARIRDDIIEFKSRIEDVNQLTGAERSRIAQLRRQIEDSTDELNQLIKMIQLSQKEEAAALAQRDQLWRDLYDLRKQFDGIKTERVAYQASLQSIRDELAFLQRAHEQEVRELKDLLVIAPADTKDFFRNEIALAIRDIRKEYDIIAANKAVELKNWYTIKVSELQAFADRRGTNAKVHADLVTKLGLSMGELKSKYSALEGRNIDLEKEVSALRIQVSDDVQAYEAQIEKQDSTLASLRQEIAVLVAELQSLLDTKQELDTEIAIYRAMVEGEEKRVGVTVVKAVEEEHSNAWEVQTKTHFQTNAHGHIAIIQCELTGRFIVLENTSKYITEKLDGWKIVRTIDGSRELTYTFPYNTIVAPSQKLRIVARGVAQPSAGVLVFDKETSWGMGTTVVTKLYNDQNVEKAVYTQKTVVA